MAVIVEIADAEDPRIADYRNIRERDLVGRRGHFIAEGEVVIRKLLAGSLHDPLSLLIDAKRRAAMADALARLPPEVPVHVAPRAVLDAIAGFPLHRGLLALGRRSAEPRPADLLAELGADAVVVVAVGVANHDNIGGIFRNAAAFGAAAVLIDHGCCDPLYRKAIRVSVGAALTVPFARFDPAEDIVATLERAGYAPVALATDGKVALSEAAPASPIAVIVGAEGSGLPRAILDRCLTVRIPMAPGFDSLNVATATGIVLHHLRADTLMRGLG